MPATLEDEYGLAHDADFIRRCGEALTVRAIAIEIEAPATANHAARLALAVLVLNNTDTYAAEAAKALSTLPAISSLYVTNHQTTDVTDTAIQTAVNTDQLWNVLAGV